ncbi:ribosomal RNA processing protein 1 homolog isoform X2 [Lytechinus pictus]|uniref:ribosomal RNA processing protein 1 homolog isoform X2 n=1 Tax=Lytechinus pictus TaxID=7653 RepID=UPI00240DE8FA|nr:ribosomal RNA processing protein 1 homolog isoform X2 [Lytechinus pictus]
MSSECLLCGQQPQSGRRLHTYFKGSNIQIGELLKRMGWRVGRRNTWTSKLCCIPCFQILGKWSTAEMKMTSAGADFFERTGHPLPKVIIEKHKSFTKKSRVIDLFQRSRYLQAIRQMKETKSAKKAWLDDLRKTVRDEMRKIEKNRNIFPSNSPALEQFDWDNIIKELKRDTPVIYRILLALFTRSKDAERDCKKSATASLGMMYMIPLHHRKQLIHQCLPLLIASMPWRCGSKRKTLSALKRLGVSKSRIAFHHFVQTQRNDESQLKNSVVEVSNSAHDDEDDDDDHDEEEEDEEDDDDEEEDDDEEDDDEDALDSKMSLGEDDDETDEYDDEDDDEEDEDEEDEDEEEEESSPEKPTKKRKVK